MDFNSLKYLGFLSGVLGIYHLIPGHKIKNYFLLLASLFFYSFFNFYLTLYMLVISVLVYYLARKIEASEENQKKLFLYPGLLLTISWIFFFKSLPNLVGIPEFSFLKVESFLYPLGISYYSFKLISYLLDVFWEKYETEKDIFYFLLYIAFFPQLPSGPIQRPDDFLEQINQKIPFKKIHLYIGIQLIVYGFFKKLVVADRIGMYINPIFSSPDQYPDTMVWSAPYFYIFQLYCDFSGFTDISIGSARLFGIISPENFDKPYLATNIPDYWRRWHISFSSWLRDYLFMPLRMSLRNFERIGTPLSLMINMIAVGLWHGFTISYFLYGFIQGVYMSFSTYTLEFRDSIYEKLHFNENLRNWIARFFTFQISVFSLIFFKVQNQNQLKGFFDRLLHPRIVINDELLLPFYQKSAFLILFLFVVVELVRDQYFDTKTDLEYTNKKVYSMIFFYSFLFIVILFSGVFYGSTFIYNQF